MDVDTANYFESVNRVVQTARRAKKAPGLSPELQEAFFEEALTGRSAASNAEVVGEPREVPAAGPSMWSQHPLFGEWAKLHPEIRLAFEGSFSNYLFIRRQGTLPQFLEFAYQQIGERIASAEGDRERRKRAAANMLQTTHVGYRSPSRDRQTEFARQIAEAKELHRTVVAR